MYGLTMQLRRSAVSVPSNIAEGQGRTSRGEFRQFLGHARGSLLEMETQLLIARNLGYVSAEAMNGLMKHSGEVSRLLHGLMQSMSQANAPQLETRN
jgi:four helix bundle protein